MLSTALFFYRYRPRHFHFTRVIPRWNTYSSFSTHSLRRVAQRKCKSMVSRASDSSSKQRKSLGDLSNDGLGNLSYKLNQLKKQIQAERVLLIKEKLEKNRRKLQIDVSKLLSATSKRDTICLEESAFQKMPLCKYSGYSQAVGDKDYISSHEVVFTTSRKLPFIERIPPYTTWIFLDRNQRMAEDQSVVGRRRIYYDQHGSEALICSDSEEENIQPEEEKHEFTEGEDRILWMAFEEHGLCDEVTDIVSRFIGVANSEIQERYSTLKESYHDNNLKDSGDSGGGKGICLEKSLSAALDSFDNLFCRRCLLFDCRLHGCSQTLIDPSEKQPYWSEYEDDRNPCSDHCYLKLKASLDVLEGSATNVSLEKNDADKAAAIPSGSGKPGGDEGMDLQSPITLGAVSSLEVALEASKMDTSSVKIMGKRKALQLTDTSANESIQNPNDLHYSSSKRQKKVLALDVINASTDAISSKDANSSHVCIAGKGTNLQLTPKDSHSESVEHMADKYVSYGNVSHEKIGDNIGDRAKVVDREAELKQSSLKSGASKGASSGSEWKPIEKELYMKGVEIFGRNSCLIARNLLSGLKTCIEVSCYMRESGSSKSYRSGSSSSFLEENGKADTDYTDQEMPTRSRLLRRRGRARKLKYSWKSAGHPSFWKRIADGKNQSCKQYTPCGCQSMCGKQCPCLDNGTCCEKYCGCSKSCKNRFRGCHCAKSQCRSRQCPCFAAGRECDPDVCRNCWVSCGDGTLSEPARRGDGQCGNMRLLLRQQQRILLAKSDIAGWGAFLKNSVNKNDYLGEYTGELISHREADKRGKIYDRANSSFLFDLNDQYVLDAYRKGDKLKFANHSSNPNCYAKVMLVAGDHRVGIFAKEHIEAKKELFYDYRYGPDQAPAWARKPDSSKNDESSFSQGRAKKHQSH